MGESQADAALVRGIVELGHALGMKVLAEGVEHVAEIAELVDMGCDFVQGYYYAHSLEAADFERLLRSGSAHLDDCPSRVDAQITISRAARVAPNYLSRACVAGASEGM